SSTWASASATWSTPPMPSARSPSSRSTDGPPKPMNLSTSKDPMSNVSVTDALRAERYDLNSDHAALDRRLFREVGPERQSALRSTWNITDEGQRLKALYAFPRTTREAHLLFS